ncbi:hypothetical protein DRO54_06995 [Candidatus Bathyarchaeota archaeon]|nr:MAG: hypothetical protein DRO54_06995 [Candidatus Bathyarchaeota archaeon]
MDPELHKLLYECDGAIIYDKSEGTVKVCLMTTKYTDVERVVDVVCRVFNLSKEDLRIGGGRSWKVLIAFKYSATVGDEVIEGGTKRVLYEVVDGVLRLRGPYGTRAYDYEKVKDLFDELGERSSAEDIVAAGRAVGLDVDYNGALMLIEFFADNINFDAEMEYENRKKTLVKLSGYLRKENVRKLNQEKEVIGTPYEVGD